VSLLRALAPPADARPAAAARPLARAAGATALLAALGLLALLAFSLPTLRRAPWPVDNDAAQYLSLALDVYHGLGFTYDGAHPEPLFAGWRWYPLLFTLAWKLAGGVSVAAAAWANKGALLACGLALLALGWRLAGALAAIGGVALFLALPLAADLTLRLKVDVLQTALLLGFLAAFVHAARGRGWGWFLAAGLALGLAQRVRESALIWLPLPLLLAALVPEWRARRVFLGGALALVAVAALVAPKLAYDALVATPAAAQGLTSTTQARLLVAFLGMPLVALAGALVAPRLPPRLLGLAALVGLVLYGTAGTLQMLATFGAPVPSPAAAAAQLGRYWDERLAETLPIWPLVLLGWGVVGWRALCGGAESPSVLDSRGLQARAAERAPAARSRMLGMRRAGDSERALLLAALAYAPVPLATALVHWDPRYFFPLQALSALAASAGLVWIGEGVARLLRAPRLAVWGGGAGLAVALAVAGWMLAHPPDEPSAREQQMFDDLTDRAAAWLVAHAPPQSAVLAHYRQTSWLRFTSDGALRVWPLPTQRPLTAADLVRASRAGSVWLNVTSYQDGGIASTYAALDRAWLADTFMIAGARYVVLTDGYGPTSLAFSDALAPPSFREVYRDQVKRRGQQQDLVIYQVESDHPALAPIPVTMTPGTLRHLADDLRAAPPGSLDLLTRQGVRLDLRDQGTRDLAPGADAGDPRTVRGFLAQERE